MSRASSSSAERCGALWDEADPKSEVVAAGLLEMGAPSVVVPEVVVNIGGSIASLNVDILFACVVEGENQLGGACRRLTLTDRSRLVLRGD